MRKLWMIVIGFVVCGSLPAAGEELTYIDLINRLTDLERLAALPAPGERCAQWSSYDRHSRYDETSCKYISWSANGDNAGFVRREDGKLVFAEMEGPGVIWRIWSAKAGEGHVKIYLDGADESAPEGWRIDLPFIGYFNRKNEPFTRSSLVHKVAHGLNCYVPIPYQKTCKITAEPDWGQYYHFTYTTYPKTTSLPTFKRDLSPAEAIALDRANEILTSCGIDPAGPPVADCGEVTELKSVTIAPGDTVTVVQLKGTRAITALKVRIDLPESPQDRYVLRELALRISWDGERDPSVWAPLGDFFGTAPGENKYKSLPMGMTEDEFYCYWYMPFEESALVELTNDGSEERTVTFTITHARLSRPIEELGRFHVKWHRDAFLPQTKDRWPDWTLLTTTGRGRFCGVMLHVWNPRGEWWGEGDEKFFVDGEKFPSTFGTGSEDYFGYAWCNPTLFSNCYHNQTISMGNKGHISVNRWHITDNIPFQESFEAVIEKYFPNLRPTLYAATAYWYLAPGGTDRYQPAPIEQRIGYWTLPLIPKVEGALEAEELEILGKTGGYARRQVMTGFGPGWGGDAHLWWSDAKPGDTLDLSVPVEKTGRYRLKMQLTKANDYAIVQLYLDGKKLGKPMDLYNDSVVPTGILDMGIHELNKGKHRLRIEIVGANEGAVKAYMFGIDYLLLTPASNKRGLKEIKSGASSGAASTDFYLPEDPSYTILDSARDSVRFAVEKTLIPYKGHLCCKSSFVDKDGNIMDWHDFGNLEGPGWAANAVGGAYEIFSFAEHIRDPCLSEKAILLLDHVLEDGFIDYETGFITGYRDVATDSFCLNYKHNNDWFCVGSMAKVAFQLLIFGDLLDNDRRDKMYNIATRTAAWIDANVKPAPNGWYPRRSTPAGKHYTQRPEGGNDPLFQKSADGLFVVQLLTALTKRGLADYTDRINEKVKLFMQLGGIFGSINHDTYDEHENVSYAAAFRVLREVAQLLGDETIRSFAYDKCLRGLDQFKMTEDRNGVQTTGLLYMEKSWDTAYLWENAEAALAYLEAYIDTNDELYLADGLTILRAIAKHHHGEYGFLTEGVDWNNHVGAQHHFNGAEYGDIKYTEPLLNNLHIVEPTLLAMKLKK